MSLRTPPIDYDSLRVAIVRCVALFTGLDGSQVIEGEPEQSDVERPALPYVSLTFTQPATRYGRDVSTLDATTGPRGVVMNFLACGRSHEEAMGIAATWQASLDSIQCREMLYATNITSCAVGNITNESALLDTGFEGRAAIDVTFGVVSYLAAPVGATIGIIDTATVTGDASGHELQATATTESQ